VRRRELLTPNSCIIAEASFHIEQLAPTNIISGGSKIEYKKTIKKVTVWRFTEQQNKKKSKAITCNKQWRFIGL
jgi:hypothetical protein